MCAVSPVVHTSNISTCQKKETFSVVCNHGEHYETPCIESLIPKACNSPTCFSSKSPSSDKYNTKAHKTNTSSSHIHCVCNRNYTAETWVSSLASSCWDFCGENGNGTGFCPSIRIRQLFPINIFLPVIHTHMSLIYHRCYIILAVDIVLNKTLHFTTLTSAASLPL